MRGVDRRRDGLFSYVRRDSRIPKDGPDPVNWSGRRAIFSGILILREDGCHATQEVQQRTDRLRSAAGREWDAG